MKSLIISTLGVFLVAVNFSDVNVALMPIQKSLGCDFSDLQWILNAYFLAFAAFTIVGGRFGDQYGHQRFFSLGLLLFILGSFIAGFSQSIWTIIGMRGLQGLGGAMLWASGIAIAAESLGEKKKSFAISIILGMAGVAVGVGPLWAGFLVEYLSWEWVFFVNVPIGIAILLGNLMFVSESKKLRKHKVDLLGIISLAVGLFLLLFSLEEVNQLGFESLEFIALVLVSLAMIVLFFRHELKVQKPLFDPNLLKNISFSGIIVVRILLMACWMSLFFMYALYFHNILKLSPIQSGLMFLPMTFAVGIIQPLGGKIINKAGIKIPSCLGMAIFAMGFIALLLVHESAEMFYFLIPFGLFGIGYGLFSAGLSIAIVKALPVKKVGLASGLYYMVSILGGSFGVALSGVFIGNYTMLIVIYFCVSVLALILSMFALEVEKK